jgi:dTDP-4-dehydrorhamnose reductase
MDRLLITGVSGFTGWNLARHLKSHYRIYGTYLDHPVDLEAVETLAFDLTNLGKIERLCSTIKPKVIVHTAALSNPDYCESHHQEALTVNTFATRELARTASHMGIRIIYFSTDLLFSGETGMYSEADAPAPLSYYAKTKHLGELEIMNNCSYYSTLRFSLLYGRSNGLNKNFVETMEQQALQNSRMNLFTNQFRTPLYVEDAVMALERFVADRSLKGLFHLGGPNRLSRFQFGELFCRTFNFPQRLLVPCLLEEAKLPAPRPRDCSLNSDKARNCLQMEFRSVEEGLSDVFKARQGIQSCT